MNGRTGRVLPMRFIQGPHPNGLVVPQWVIEAGYEPTARRLPQEGELFYDPGSDKVLRVRVPEARAFVIVEYRRGR